MDQDFTKIRLSEGYWQILIDTEPKKKTAFVTTQMLPVQENAVWVSQFSSNIQPYKEEDVVYIHLHQAYVDSHPHSQMGKILEETHKAAWVNEGSSSDQQII